MKHSTQEVTINLNGIDLPINNNPSKGYACYVEILRCIEMQMRALLSHHNKILVVRVDLHTTKHTQKNTIISVLTRRLRKKLINTYGISRLGYIWVREQERAKQQHYHLALFIDANKVQFPSRLLSIVESAWISLPNCSKPFVPKNCFYKVIRGDDNAFKEAFTRLSYLAKVRGKGYKPQATNDFSSSRIKFYDSS